MQMTIMDAQEILKAAGAYSGKVDGIAGPNTKLAVKAVLDPLGEHWTKERRLIGAVQVLLNKYGHEAGAVDGYAGHNTLNAFEEWEHKQKNDKALVSIREPISTYKAPKGFVPRQNEVREYYGAPGDAVKSQLTTIRLPFKFRIDWNLGQMTNGVTVHKRAAPSLEKALIEVHNYYGEEEWRALGLDRYAGAYNHRKMRNGRAWSMHAYGCAIDFYAAPNGLRTRCPKALFCGAVYKPFLDIMERNTWLPAIRLWGGDAMHFQRAQL